MTTVDWINQFIASFCYVYALFIVLHVILGMLQVTYSPWLGRLRGLTYDTVDPFLNAFRRVLPSMGAFDLSPMIAIFAVLIGGQILQVIVGSFN
jgi:YggT family protein